MRRAVGIGFGCWWLALAEIVSSVAPHTPNPNPERHPIQAPQREPRPYASTVTVGTCLLLRCRTPRHTCTQREGGGAMAAAAAAAAAAGVQRAEKVSVAQRSASDLPALRALVNRFVFKYFEGYGNFTVRASGLLLTHQERLVRHNTRCFEPVAPDVSAIPHRSNTPSPFPGQGHERGRGPVCCRRHVRGRRLGRDVPRPGAHAQCWIESMRNHHIQIPVPSFDHVVPFTPPSFTPLSLPFLYSFFLSFSLIGPGGPALPG